MYSVAGKNVLITGAAMGMGKLFAEHAVANGGVAILWDINREALEQTAAELRAQGGTVHTYVVDVSNRAKLLSAAQQVQQEIGDVDVLINNAGIVVGALFWEHEDQQIQATMDINILALMYLAKAVIPGMLKKGSGRILNFASAAGLVSNPKMSVYCSSKWAVIGWSDSLRLELEQEGHKDIKVTTVTPSYVNTGMFDGVKAPMLTPIIEPGPFIKKVWKGLMKGKPVVRAPWSVNLLPFLKGLLPVRWFDAIVGRFMGVYKSMKDFKGHDGKPMSSQRQDKDAA